LHNIPNYTECLHILLENSVPFPVISHLVLTTQTAVRLSSILKDKNIEVNCDLVIAGAMLHDLGRCSSHDIDHGIIGGNMLNKMNFPIELVRVVENHLFAGITAQEAKNLNLPFKDYIPITIEEKIVAYSDNISKKQPLLTTEQVSERLSRYLHENHPIIKRIQVLHNEMDLLLK
jgi:uncharacterized protein